MYAESRLPGRTRLEFTARWRSHGAFALAHESFRASVGRYVHHDPVAAPDDFPKANNEYDGLGEIAAEDPDTLARILGHPDMTGPIGDDGDATFAQTRTIHATVEEHYLRDNHRAPYSVSTFVSADGDPGRAVDLLRADHTRFLEELAPLANLARRVGVSGSVEMSPTWAAYIDLGFDTRAEAACAYAVWRPAFDNSMRRLAARTVTLVTARCAFYEVDVLM